MWPCPQHRKRQTASWKAAPSKGCGAATAKPHGISAAAPKEASVFFTCTNEGLQALVEVALPLNSIANLSIHIFQETEE